MEPARDNHRLLPLRRGEHALAAVAVVGIVGASIVCLRLRGHEFLFYIAVLIGIVLAVWSLHRRIGLSHASLWALLAWAALHLAGGLVRVPAPAEVLYGWWIVPGVLKYDQVVHAYGFGVTAWVAWQVLRTRVRPPHHSPIVLAAAAFSAMGLGAGNEMVEFAATKLVPKTHVGDYENNAWDLVFNALGAIAAVGLIRVFHATGQERPPA